ncbi:SRPBCC domain-containing protein [Aureivirga marina]|uniref:SRPBCC domain-containing protein n=1 Tax=Aureivirga marina TaxID=1182451 RepID=UPI0018CACBE0|nr:SRPBCC domain-containing protein [Aureivirga marina]
MKHIKTEIIIEASSEKIWNVLMDFKNYGKWNPFILKINGVKKEGKRLKVNIQPPNGKKMTFRPVIIKLEKEKVFRWIGRLGVKGVFDGEHYFELISEDENKTRFIHGEKFTGILVATAGKAIEKTKQGFDLMNIALKEKCEEDS